MCGHHQHWDEWALKCAKVSENWNNFGRINCYQKRKEEGAWSTARIIVYWFGNQAVYFIWAKYCVILATAEALIRRFFKCAKINFLVGARIDVINVGRQISFNDISNTEKVNYCLWTETKKCEKERSESRRVLSCVCIFAKWSGVCSCTAKWKKTVEWGERMRKFSSVFSHVLKFFKAGSDVSSRAVEMMPLWPFSFIFFLLYFFPHIKMEKN